MRRSTVVIFVLLLLWSAGAVALSMAVYRAASRQGMLELSITDPDARIRLEVPAAFATLVLSGILWDAPRGHVRFGHEVEDWTPALRAALEELERYDEVPLLEVHSGHERVRVEKRGDSILIRIEDGRGERVSISMPAATLERVLAAID